MPRGADRRVVLFLLVVPLLLLGPLVLRGRVFLPQLATALEPYRSEDPARAAEALAGRNLLQSDRLFPFLTDQLAMRAALADGELPLWEPNLGLGLPLFAQSAAGMAYPPNWLALLVPPERAAGPLAGLGLLLAGLGCWLFLQRRGLSSGACLVGAVAFQLGGWGVSNLYYHMKFDAALWLPWALWAVEGLAQRKRWSGTCLTAAIGASLLAGMIQVGVLVFLFTGLYALLRLGPLAGALRLTGGAESTDAGASSETGALPALLGAGLSLVLGGLSACVLLVPMLQCSRDSLRRPRDAEAIEAMSLAEPVLLGTVVSDLFGTPTADTPPGRLPAAWWLTDPADSDKAEIANPLEWNAYAGLVVVLLALVALVSDPRRALAPLLLLLGVVGFSLGWWPMRLFYALPGLDLGAPGRALGLAWFLWPWLAALGVEALVQRRARAQRAFLALAFGAAVLGFAAWSGFDAQGWAERVEAGMIADYEQVSTPADVRARLPHARSVAVGEELGGSVALGLGAALAALAAGAAGLFLSRGRPGEEPVAPGLLVTAVTLVPLLAALPALDRALSLEHGPPLLALVLVGAGLAGLVVGRSAAASERSVWLPILAAVLAEGLLATHGHATGRTVEGPLFPPSPGLTAVAEAADGGRVIRVDTSPGGVEEVLDLARPNMLQPHGVADVTPWVVFPPRTFVELFAAVDRRTAFAQGVSRLPDPALLGHPILDLARVSAVLSRGPLEHARLEPILERPGFHVYRRTGALPPARLVANAVVATSDPAGLATLGGGLVEPAHQTLLAPEHADHPGLALRATEAGTITRIERPARGRIEIDVAGSQGSWLVVHEQHDRGWKPRVDGAAVDLLRMDHAFLGVHVPPGDHRIELRYAPGSLRLGFGLSLLAIAGALLAARRLGI